MPEAPKDRFPLLRKILSALGLSSEAIDDIIERILDFLATKEPAGTGKEVTNPFPYQLRDDFLSKAELSFCLVLRSVVGDRAQICPKVALKDLFFAKTGDPRQNRVFTNKIDQKHVDFLLCDPKTLRPLAGIELDDRSHAREDRQKRDSFVEGVFAACNLPLVRVPVKVGYAPSEIETLLRPLLCAPSPSNTPTEKPVAFISDPDLKYAPPEMRAPVAVPHAPALVPSQTPTCPKCAIEMVLRTAGSGANAGKQFWGCKNYPKCRFNRPLVV